MSATARRVSQLRALEAEAVFVIREVVADLSRPVLLFSGGKDSVALLRVAEKAFRPLPLPFGVMHVDTGHNFPEVIEFRDRRIVEAGHQLIVASVQESIDAGRVREEGPGASRNRLQTVTLLDALEEHGFDAAFGGARRDEERARAKERVLSFRDEFGQWEPRAQRAEPWTLYNARIRRGEHIRVFPLSNWTEVDVWRYIEAEDLELPSIYFAHRRRVLERDGILLAESEWIRPGPGEQVEETMVRYRTVGDLTVTGAVRSEAADIASVIAETEAATVSERGETRADDRTNRGGDGGPQARGLLLMPAAELTGQRDLLRLATAGSVDDGKSTLIGRLLLDTGSLLADHLEDVSRSGALDLAAVTDGLRAEREQGITIDVAYRYFSTPRRAFILADTPGHERYTRNMFTGASTADAALVLIDARSGVVTQTRRHAHIAALLGIEHIVVCVNKMDLAGWEQERFEEIRDEVYDVIRRLQIPDLTVIPISALHGDNVAVQSEHTPFYDGPTLLEYLEELDVQADRDLSRLRLPVQWVGRPRGGESRLYTGRIVAGTLAVGDEVVVLPAGVSTTITHLDTLDDDAETAVPPMSVTFGLADHLDVGRGDLLVAPDDQPTTARELECTVCWMSEEPLHPGRRYALKHATRTVRATVQAITERTDPETLERQLEPTSLALNDIGRVTLRTSAAVVADPYAVNRVTGAFILIDEDSNDTVAAGAIRRARAVEAGRERRRDVTWHPSALDRDERWLAIDQRGATVLLTGLPASGKSTIAVELERRLVDSGQSAYLLDGDNIRHGLSEDLGFSPGDRSEHIRRVGQVARLMADSGTVAVVSLISPVAADRAHLRTAHAEANLPFVEVFVDTPVEECERRDPKGLYARARAGEIKGFTGVDAPYEPPQHPELRVDTAATDVQQAVDQIIELLRTRPRVLAKGATMRISAKADYAVRAAIELAAANGTKAVPAERIATSQGIPLNFLEHILSELRIAGVVRSQRGTEGGYRLAREPGLITIADIIRAVEGPLATVRGGKPEEAEYPGPATQLPRVWIAVRKNLRTVVEHVTVADVANASLPDSINSLADDPEAWVTR